jgi:hypothetical protein
LADPGTSWKADTLNDSKGPWLKWLAWQTGKYLFVGERPERFSLALCTKQRTAMSLLVETRHATPLHSRRQCDLIQRWM